MARLVAVFVLALAAACGGSDSPTEPTLPTPGSPTSTRTVTIHYVVATEDWRRDYKIQEVHLLWDGRVIKGWSGTAANMVGLDVSVTGVTPGRHELGVRIVRQTTSPSRYLLGNPLQYNFVTLVTPDQVRRTIDLPRPTVTVQTGQATSQTVTIP